MFEIVPKPESGAQSVLLEVIIPAEPGGGTSSPDIDPLLPEHIQDMGILQKVLPHGLRDLQGFPQLCRGDERTIPVLQKGQEPGPAGGFALILAAGIPHRGKDGRRLGRCFPTGSIFRKELTYIKCCRTFVSWRKKSLFCILCGMMCWGKFMLS